MLFSENEKLINMWLTIFVTGKMTECRQNPLAIVWKSVKLIFALMQIQRKHYSVPYDALKGIYLQNGGWCVEDTIESYQKYQMAFLQGILW